MSNQVLNEEERKKIRASLHSENLDSKNINYNNKIKFFIKYTDSKKVLDLGSVDHHEDNCRSDHWLFKALQNNSKSIVGLDYYEKGVNSLREKGYNIIYGDAQNFKFNSKFEVVTAGDLIEHLQNLDGFLNSVKNALDSDGLLIISTPNPWCWKYFLYHLFFRRLKPLNKEHVAWFCTQSLSQLCSRYGFKIIETSYSSHRFYENLVPLPQHIKHTTLNLAFSMSQSK
jgi:2-polyprenyl-3-methyl-5-hydroxy-6-metoxy-1,4-benzoquinol methylase